MPKEYIFFDIGSTLMDGPDLSPASRFARELELSESQKETINNFLFTEEITHPDLLIERFRFHLPEISASSDEIIRKIWDAQSKEGHIIKGAIEAIEYVSGKGYEAGIISNIWHPYYMCFEKLFSDVIDKLGEKVLSYRVGYKKPSTEIFRIAFQKLGGWSEKESFINPQKCTMVGDSYYHDMIPAMEIGMKTVWILKEKKREKEYIEKVFADELPAPDYMISGIGKLREILN